MFEAIIFIGLQASGKSSFYQWKFSHSHLRLNLDMLKTRNREKILLEACLRAKQSCVIDNTNPTVDGRAKYISAAREQGFKVIGYYFQSNIKDCLRRNAAREGKQKIPEPGIRGTNKKMVLPAWSEGFDELYYVIMNNNDDLKKDPGLNKDLDLDQNRGFEIREWQSEV